MARRFDSEPKKFIWKPKYSVAISVIISVVISIIMYANYLQYKHIMEQLFTESSSIIANPENIQSYQIIVLIGFINLLIISGGIIFYILQKRRNFNKVIKGINEELAETSQNCETMRKQYELITENVSDVIITLDMDGKITYITPSIEDYLGYTPEEFIDAGVEKFLSRRSMRAVAKDIIFRKQEPAKFKEVNTYEMELKRKDKHRIWVELKTVGISEGEKKVGFLGIFRDVTKRRKNERFLKFQSDVMYNISDEVVITDTKGKILYVNKAVLLHTGLKRKDLIGKTQTVKKATGSDSITKKELIETVNKDGKWEGILSSELPNGNHRVASSRCKLLYDDYKKPIAIIAISTDITDQISIEEELKESEKKYRLLITNVSDVIWTSYKDFNINFITRSVGHFLGYDPEAFLKMKQTEYLSPDALDKISKLKRRINYNFNSVNFPIIFNAQLICKDNTRKWAEAKINPLLEEDGEVVGFVGVWRDITSFILTTERNKTLEDRLSQGEKMEALGRLAGGVAHDLNNVLTGIVAYPDLLMLKMDDDDPLRKKVMAIKKSGEKAASIVEDLLSLSRRGVNKFAPVNVNKAVKDVLESPEIEKLQIYHSKISIKFSEDKTTPSISGAEFQISKVLVNLLTNAAESIENDGEIFISTKFESSKNRTLRFSNIPEGDYTVLSVTDEGVGISKEDQKRIFEPFFTSKTMGRSGTGLGMAVVWGAVKDHDGFIELTSKVGTGTTFDLYFPALAGTSPIDEVKLDRKSYQGNGERILVLDDEEVQLDIAESLLSEINYKVKVTNDVKKINSLVKSYDPDVILLDMILGDDKDGLDVYNEIIKTRPKQKIIIISGYSESERIKEALKLGAKKYIKKPYTIEDIAVNIKEVLLEDSNE
ncbi:MAG: PAS domain S-box protein [Candidatus Delongbacteria bacterium]|nr:PAS domain S-box protein [Candidatus Delongbacteria bacterium]